MAILNQQTVIIQRDAGVAGTQVTQGDQVAVYIGVSTEQLVQNSVHGNAADDGIAVDGNLNIRLAIGELQSLP